MKSPFGLALAIGLATACALPAKAAASGQDGSAQLTERGQISVGGQSTTYLIRRLPVSSFPELPAEIERALNQRGCMIPQTYQAHRPENVVHGSLKHSGSSDWAVLCSAKGTVSLLVFFTDEASAPIVLASAPETERLQASGSDGTLGFNWGIDAATPAEVHEAQAGLSPRPPMLDHDALADETLDKGKVYHFYIQGKWARLPMPE